MNLKELFNDEDAVSPVIGVILMVAITVILAAVIGTFVLGLGDQVQTTAPQASFGFDFDDHDDDGTVDELIITHNGGDNIEDGNRLTTSSTASLGGETWSGQYGGSAVGAGDSIQVSKSGGAWSGETVRVAWQSANGDQSATLGKSTAS